MFLKKSASSCVLDGVMIGRAAVRVAVGMDETKATEVVVASTNVDIVVMVKLMVATKTTRVVVAR